MGKLLAGLALAAGMAAKLWAGRAFSRLVQSDVQILLAGSSGTEARLVTEAMLDGPPEPVSRYLRYTGIIGKPFVRTVHLKQRGRMLLSSGQPSIPLKAQQWYSVRTPGLVWYATLHIGPIRSRGRATCTGPEPGTCA